jgi:protein-disulfide isomerase
MRRHLFVAASIFAAGLLAAMSTAAQTPAPPARSATDAAPSGPNTPASDAIAKRVEAFLRNEYAWGPDYKLKIGPFTPAPAGDLYQVPVEVTAEGGTDSAILFVSKDGHYMFRGELTDLNKDPLAETRSQLHLENYASKGPANAKVVLVEFGDFECPSCRQLDVLLRTILPQYPQVRLVFKDFPLEQIHPWAMTGALAGRCVLQQSQDAFWKFHDAVYDNQDAISPENAYAKLADLAQQAGAKPDTYKICMADPKTPEAVRQSLEEGKAVQITGTPTTFIDGRRIVGPDASLLKQYMDFDLNASAQPVR